MSTSGILSRVLETALPARLGRGFRWLVASSWTTNIGDGVARRVVGPARGLTVPFWFAFVGSALTLALVWRQLDLIAHTPRADVEESAPPAR